VLKSVTKIEKVSSTVTEKTKRLKLLERMRNLSTTYSDGERVGKPPEKLKSYHDDQAEHSRGGGYWRGVSMQRHCKYCMHKDNIDYKDAKKRRDKGLSLCRSIKGVQGGRAQEQKCIVEEWCIEGIWCREHKRLKNRKCKGRVEDTDADRAEQCNRTTTRMVSH
jgi:hypothetical protein